MHNGNDMPRRFKNFITMIFRGWDAERRKDVQLGNMFVKKTRGSPILPHEVNLSTGGRKINQKIVSLNLIEFHCLCLCMCVLDHVWSCWVRYLWIFKDCRLIFFTFQVASPFHEVTRSQNCLIGVHCLFARLLPTLPKTSRLETYGNMGSNRSLQINGHGATLLVAIYYI